MFPMISHLKRRDGERGARREEHGGHGGAAAAAGGLVRGWGGDDHEAGLFQGDDTRKRVPRYHFALR